MLEKHMTKEGNVLLVAEMEDSHLENLIAMFLVKIIKNKRMINGQALDPYQAALYNIPKHSAESLAKENRELIGRLYPYLAEAYLRGLSGNRQQLVEAMGRGAAIVTGLHELPATVEDIPGWDY
jgi:hypothetical protein